MKRNLKAFLAKEIGTRIYLRIYWGEDCLHGSYHNAMKFIKDVPDIINNSRYGGQPEDYNTSEWPSHCDHCGSAVPPEGIVKQVFNTRLYDTESGNLEPGALFWANWMDGVHWDNDKEQPALMAVLPNGTHWNIDGRASNCGSPNDRLHRCWVRHGEPPNVTVDKSGHTCAAGAGSISVSGWHGFLQNGFFIEC